MEWNILLQAYPEDQTGIYKTKELHERIDRSMADMELPMLDEHGQEIAGQTPVYARCMMPKRRMP